MVELNASETNHCSRQSILDREHLCLLGFMTQLSQCLIVADRPATTLVRTRGPPMSLSLSEETEVFKGRTAKEKRIRTGNPSAEIRLDDVGHIPLHMEEKGCCRQCKKIYYL
ncbi:hypothetical protein RF11_12721 [Thelohanellus kitauei]|uniref:Uncharacterized protein n=1 Tax=Thelohanellus kitauei TaxID=669202 RepID=A0A0C2MGT0_THEKT|nr:hypothetical protein RF11_06114 [Thelohanellus kitauei]KII64829.1 hypothetical protein RF11_03333 [Thelohanellus kitauei]KII66691.1 hypothetical protein RF11_12721 [Thelohanellus kitauei]